MEAEPAVRVRSLDKTFRIPAERTNSLKQAVINWRRQKYRDLRVLKKISFDVNPGDFFGIIGRNGSGKSTLLKILAGIYQPSSGSVMLSGSLTPFIELGVGFNMELSGKDNVFLNGAILGLTRKEVEAKYREIVAFAELEQFMDQKLKNYSSGMQVRLAFSVAIQAHSDILLVDEVLAVGDAGFQRKCYDYFHKLKGQQKTVILVTHDMAAIQEFCDYGVVLDQAKVVAVGPPSKLVSKYEELHLQLSRDNFVSEEGVRINNGATIERFYSYKKQGRRTSVFTPRDKTLCFGVEFKALRDLENPFVGLAITNLEGRVVFATDSQHKGLKLGEVKKGDHFKTTFFIQNVYSDDTYTVSTAVDSNDRKTSYARWDSGLTIRTYGWPLSHSLVHPDHKIELVKTRRA